VLRKILVALASVILVLVAVVSAWVAVEYYAPTQREAQTEAKDKSNREAVDILASERVAYYTKILAILTGSLGALGAVQLLFVYRADETARTSADAALKGAVAAETAAQATVAGQRPWIKADFLILDSLSWISDALVLPVKVTLTNVGNTPATNVMPWINFYVPNPPAIPPPWFHGIAKGRQEASIFDASMEIGKTIFPGDPDRIPFALRINRKDVGGAITAAGGNPPVLIISGVITYRFAGGRGETPFAFELVQRHGGAVGPVLTDKCPVRPDFLALNEIRAGPSAT
jgi:hypothetical protein